MKKITIITLTLLSLALASCKLEDGAWNTRMDASTLSLYGNELYKMAVVDTKENVADWLEIQNFLKLPAEAQNADSNFSIRRKISVKDEEGYIIVEGYGKITVSSTPLDEVGGVWSTENLKVECTGEEQWSIGVSYDYVERSGDRADFRAVLRSLSGSSLARKQWNLTVTDGVYDEGDGYSLTFCTEPDLVIDDSLDAVSGSFYSEVLCGQTRKDWVRLVFKPRSTKGYWLTVETSRGEVK